MLFHYIISKHTLKVCNMATVVRCVVFCRKTGWQFLKKNTPTTTTQVTHHEHSLPPVLYMTHLFGSTLHNVVKRLRTFPRDLSGRVAKHSRQFAHAALMDWFGCPTQIKMATGNSHKFGRCIWFIYCVVHLILLHFFVYWRVPIIYYLELWKARVSTDKIPIIFFSEWSRYSWPKFLSVPWVSSTICIHLLL